jgi:hypothetical protein
MSNVTNNKASTKMRIALPEHMLPVVIPWPREKKDRSGEYFLGGVRQLSPRDLDLYLDNRKMFESIYGPTVANEKELRFLIRMADAVANRSLPRLRNALEQFIGHAEAKKELEHPAGFHGMRELSSRFIMRTHGAAPIVYWSDSQQRLAFGLHCSDISTALFLLALERVGVGSIGHCKACSMALIGDRANKRFCGDNCRSRYFMRQLRARSKKVGRARVGNSVRKGTK